MCVYANSSTHGCDLSLIIRSRMLKLLLSRDVFLQRLWYHQSYLNITTVNTLKSPPSKVTCQVSAWLGLTTADRYKGFFPALNGLAVARIITGVGEEMDWLTTELLLPTVWTLLFSSLQSQRWITITCDGTEREPRGGGDGWVLILPLSSLLHPFWHGKRVNLAGPNLLIAGYWCDPSGVETLH